MVCPFWSQKCLKQQQQESNCIVMVIKPGAPPAHAIWPVDQLLIIPLNHHNDNLPAARPKCKQGNSHSLLSPLQMLLGSSKSGNIWMEIINRNFLRPSLIPCAQCQVNSSGNYSKSGQINLSVWVLVIKNKQSWSFRNKSCSGRGWWGQVNLKCISPTSSVPAQIYLLTRVEH